MHFRIAKIEVATSVCTGGRNCPPDSSIVMGSNPATEKSPKPTKADFGLLVRMTGFEPAASCSQSKRSTKLSHIRECCLGNVSSFLLRELPPKAMRS